MFSLKAGEWIGFNAHFDIDVVPSDDLLPSNVSDLDLDVHDAKRLGADVDLDQSRIDGLVELSESLDKADRSLFDVPEWVGEGTARNGAQETDTATQTLHHGPVDTVGNLPSTQVLRVRRLHLGPLERLDVNDLFG